MTNPKIWDLVLGIGLRMIGIRLIIVGVSIALFLLKVLPADILLLIGAIFVMVTSAGVYFWGGGKASKLGYSFEDTIKLAILMGVATGAVTTTKNFEIGDFLFAIGVEVGVAVIFMAAGALYGKKIRVE